MTFNGAEIRRQITVNIWRKLRRDGGAGGNDVRPIGRSDNGFTKVQSRIGTQRDPVSTERGRRDSFPILQNGWKTNFWRIVVGRRCADAADRISDGYHCYGKILWKRFHISLFCLTCQLVASQLWSLLSFIRFLFEAENSHLLLKYHFTTVQQFDWLLQNNNFCYLYEVKWLNPNPRNFPLRWMF